jgi:hypothetical protein
VIWETVRRIAARANVRSHAHAVRAAFAVRFDEAHPDQLFALKDLFGHALLDTTLVYLRRRKKQLAMSYRLKEGRYGWSFGGNERAALSSGFMSRNPSSVRVDRSPGLRRFSTDNEEACWSMASSAR